MTADAPPPPLITALRRVLAIDGTPVDLIQTHISWVLLAGDTAWKIKKPVRLPFLDFSTLAQRHHFCTEELRLNRRHAPTLYLAVVAITGSEQAPRLGGDGPAIDYAVQMRRFAPGALFSERLAVGSLLPAHLDALALKLAAQQQTAEVAPADSLWGQPETVARQLVDVLNRLQRRGRPVAELQAWLLAQEPGLRTPWQQRLQAGCVRECHGDLHLRNAVVLDEGVAAFDGIEFDPALRWIDVQSDIAFMAMDLLAHRQPALAWRFVNAWLDATGDHGGVAVLRPYLVYRALVRALVQALSPHADGEAATPDYLALAQSLALSPPQARLLVTHGLSGSGKTWVTQALLEHTGALRLRSDVERKRLFGLGALEDSAAHVPGGIYQAPATERTYSRLLDLARSMLASGWPVIVDAACLRHSERAQFAALAAELALPFTLLDCQASAETLRQRVRQRQLRRDDASEADEAVLARQQGFDEPFSTAERACSIVVQTDAPLDIAALAARWVGSGAHPEAARS